MIREDDDGNRGWPLRERPLNESKVERIKEEEKQGEERGITKIIKTEEDL